MRGLSGKFMADLTRGFLAPLRKRIVSDKSLCLEIRENYINIYYRGGNLLRLTEKKNHIYEAFFDPKYSRGQVRALGLALPSQVFKQPGDLDAWLDVWPTLKLAMDLWMGKHPKEEREAQQLIVRDNNFGAVSNATDYYFCDIEYANKQGRFDLVGVHWPSTPACRKETGNRRLVIAEAKFGDGALTGAAGLHAHVNDINGFLGKKRNVSKLKTEMVNVFNQKQELGLINCKKKLTSFSDEKPLLLFILANHDPAKTNLKKLLNNLPSSPNVEICFATSVFMGYGLFEQGIYSENDFIAKFEGCI